MFSLIGGGVWIIFHTSNFNQQGSSAPANGHHSLIARALPPLQLRQSVTHAGPTANLYLGVCVLSSDPQSSIVGVGVGAVVLQCVRVSPSVISAHRLEVCRRQLSMPAACVDDVDEVKQWLPKYHLVSLAVMNSQSAKSVTSRVN